MDFQEPVSAAVRSLRANKMRSALTTLGIIIGVAAVIVVVGLVQGLKSSVLKQIEKAGSQTLTVRPVFPGDMPYEEFTKIKNKDLTIEDMRSLQRLLPQITQMTPLFYNGAEAKSEGHRATVNIIMTDESYLELNSINVISGRNFVPSDVRLGNKVAVIGPHVVEKLGIKGNPIGKTISTSALSLEIIGILEEQGSTLGNDPDNIVIIPLSTGMAQLSDVQHRQLWFQARLNPRISADDGADLVEDALRRIKGLRAKEPSGFKVFNLKQLTSIIGGITNVITAVAGGMVSIALMVGGIGIMNIMLVSVTERTREIGVRKAVGAKRKDILLQFLIEASFLCIFGGAVGILLGYSLGAILSKILFDQMSGIPLWAVVSAFMVPAGIGLVFGMYPAVKASKLNPIEALRYE